MKPGLVLIDIQNDYFPGGKFELEGSIEASIKTQKLLAFFRQNQFSIFHVQHISIRQGAKFFFPNTEGVKIHSHVQPYADELVISKHHPNSFRDSLLKFHLQQANINHLVICGMMTHMAVDATVRAAYDEGFKSTVIADACATKSLAFRDMTVLAAQVHAASLATLSYLYATVQTADEFIAAYLEYREVARPASPT
ncbi:MAG TPA: cysteine hydrolase family protein [Allocoleopsis sp.]